MTQAQRVTNISPGDFIAAEEDIFSSDNRGKLAFIGKRTSIFHVLGQAHPEEAKVEIIKSTGVNFLPIGAVLSRPFANLSRGYQVNHLKQENVLKSGGHLEGVENGKPVALDTATKGGMSVGAKHTEDGIKGVVGTQKAPIEFEGEEIILTAPVSHDETEYEFEGKKMKAREIASHLNVENGGVSFADGGDVKCRCSGKRYKLGGLSFTDFQILSYLNGNSHK